MPREPIVFGRDFFIFEPEKAALIVIDMQNAFVEEGATFESVEARRSIPKMEQIIDFARRNAMPVIWTQSDHSAPHAGILLDKFPTIREERYLWKDEHSFELYPDMTQPLEGEYRVVKHKYDAFFETDLDSILRNLRVEQVVIIGTATNVCCESTARAAFFRDYKVCFPSDANQTFDPDMQRGALKTIDTFFGRVMSTEELLAEAHEFQVVHADA